MLFPVVAEVTIDELQVFTILGPQRDLIAMDIQVFDREVISNNPHAKSLSLVRLDTRVTSAKDHALQIDRLVVPFEYQGRLAQVFRSLDDVRSRFGGTNNGELSGQMTGNHGG